MRNAIGEALAFHRSIGIARKEARLRYLRKYWQDRLRGNPRVILRNADDARQSGAIGALTVKGMGGPQLTEILGKQYRIHTRVTLDEIDRFTGAVQEIAHC